VNVSDEMLMAYVDGELDDAARAAVEAAVAADPVLARRVVQQQALSEKLRATFDRVLAEPVPERLIDTARSAPMGGAQVADLGARRAARADARERRWALPQWAAMAASLVLGVFVGWAWLSGPDQRSEMLATREGRLVAEGELAQALDQQLASQRTAEASVQVGVSFRDQANDYCRTFVLRDGVAGLACHKDLAWQVRALAQGSEARGGESGQMRMAGVSLPPAIVMAIQGSIAGEPLDADAEAAAQRAGWK